MARRDEQQCIRQGDREGVGTVVLLRAHRKVRVAEFQGQELQAIRPPADNVKHFYAWGMGQNDVHGSRKQRP